MKTIKTIKTLVAVLLVGSFASSALAFGDACEAALRGGKCNNQRTVSVKEVYAAFNAKEAKNNKRVRAGDACEAAIRGGKCKEQHVVSVSEVFAAFR